MSKNAPHTSSSAGVAAEAAQLSLKNIYRLLSMQDYPRPAPAILVPNAMKGVTLVRFWHDLLREALPPTVSLELFDTRTKRSRALSSMLNGAGGG